MNRRIKRMEVSCSVLEKMMFDPEFLCNTTSDAPKDLKIERVYQDPHMEFKGTFCLFLTSESFEEVPEGALIPEYQVYFYKCFPNPQPEVATTGVN